LKDITGTARIIAKPSPFKDETLEATAGAGITLRQILGNSSNGYIINVNGNNVECENWDTQLVETDDLVLIYRLPAGDNGRDILRLFAAIAVLIFANWAAPHLAKVFWGSEAFWSSALMFVGFLALGLLLPPILPLQDNGQRKRLNSLTGTRNRFAPFAPIPNPYGKHRIYPPIAAVPWTEVIGEDQYLNMIYCIGLGDYYMGDGTHMKIGDTPILEYNDLDVEITDQPDQPDIFELQQNLVLSQSATPGTSQTRTTAADTEEISIDFVLPAGLIQIDDDDGDRHHVEIHFSVEWRVSGSADPWVFVNASNGDFGRRTRGRRQVVHGTNVRNANDYPPPASTSAGSVLVSNRNANWLKVTARTRDPIRVGVRWEVDQAANSFDVRVTRQETKRPTLGPIIDSDPGWDQYAAQFSWTALRSIKTTPAILLPAQTATFAVVRIRATDQLNGIIDTFNLVPERKLRNWNKAGQTMENVPAFDGSATGVTRDPAWAYLDILTGLGNARPIAPADETTKIDLDDLADWATENTTEGFFYDEVIDYSTSVFDALTKVSGVGRAALSNRDGMWTVILEDNATGPVQYFTPRNSWGFTSTKRFVDFPHAFKVRFNSEDSDYQEDEMIVYDDGYNSGNATKFEVLELAGITDSDQAWKVARYTMASIRLRPEIYTFNADMEHIVAQRGDHIRVAHDIPLWGTVYGRIIDISGNDVTLDSDTSLDGGTTYRMRVRIDTGASVIETLTLQSGNNIVTHTFTPSIPAGIKIGDLAMVGEVGVESQELVVVSIEPSQDLTARITCVDHNSAILTADDGAIPAFTPNITLPIDPTQISPVRPFNVVATSNQTSFVTDGSAIIQPRITVTWDLESNSAIRWPSLMLDVRWREYDVSVTPDSGTWNYIRDVNAFQASISIENVDLGNEYEIELRTVTQYDVPSVWTTAILHTVGGATRLPTIIDALVATGEPSRIRLDIDITSNIISNASHLEITHSTTNNRVTPTPVVENFAIPADTNALTDLTVFVQISDILTHYFWARIVDVYGNASDYFPVSSTAGVPAIASSPASEVGSAQDFEYDDLDTTQLAAGPSRYALLDDDTDNTSGSQNNFHLTEALLINKVDLAGINRASFYQGLAVGTRIVFYVSAVRWYHFETTAIGALVGSGAAAAYKFNVNLIEYYDPDPTVNISTSAGTTIQFQYQVPVNDTFNLLLDPDFDLSTGFGFANGFWGGFVKDSGGGGSTDSTISFNAGGGSNGSNAIGMSRGNRVFSQVQITGLRKLRHNFGAFEFRIRYKTASTGADINDFTVFVESFADPTDVVEVSETNKSVVITRTNGVWTTLRIIVEAPAQDTGQYWRFGVSLSSTLQQITPTITIDSVFVYGVSDVFGNETLGTKVISGSVPESDTTTDAGKYLKADGTWDDPPGGFASNSFETHTVDDTDTEYSWSAIGSAVAESATDTLTWVSGVGIDIDVDAALDAIRITTVDGEIDHDSLLNYDADQHIDWSVTGVENIHADRLDAFEVDKLVFSGTDVFQTLGAGDTRIYANIAKTGPFQDADVFNAFIAFRDDDNSHGAGIIGYQGSGDLDIWNIAEGGSISIRGTQTGGGFYSFANFDPDVGAQFLNVVIFDASSTVNPSFNIPEGVAPTAPVDGDVWVTTTDIFARINGVSESLISTGIDWEVTGAEDIHIDRIPEGSITSAKMANRLAMSVMGRSSTIGIPQDMVAGSDGDVLRRSGSAIGFGTISVALDDLSDVDTAGVATGDLLYKSAGDWLDTGGKLTWDPAGETLRLTDSASGDYMEFEANSTNCNFLANVNSFSFFPNGVGLAEFVINSTYSGSRSGNVLRVYDSANGDYFEISHDGAAATIGTPAGDGAVIVEHEGNPVLQTQDNNGTDNITGAEIKHWDGSFYDVGMARMPKVNFTGATTVSDTHWHKRLVHNGTADTSINLTFNTESSQPQDVVLWVMAKNGPVVLVDGTMVLNHYAGSGAPATGNITIARGGWATVVKDGDSNAEVTGVGLS
jgi:hypothetical protein